jgi:hypothetical protein
MIDVQAKRDALQIVTGAAAIHKNGLIDSLKTNRYGGNESFLEARQRYIDGLDEALKELQGVRFEDGAKLHERVKDLTLEESVRLLHAVQDHLRTLV